VVGFGVSFVAVDVDGVVQQIVLVSRLLAVKRERPVDEIVYLTNESDVVVDGAIVIGRSQERAILPVDAARVPLHEVLDLVSQLVVHGQLPRGSGNATSALSGIALMPRRSQTSSTSSTIDVGTKNFSVDE